MRENEYNSLYKIRPLPNFLFAILCYLRKDSFAILYFLHIDLIYIKYSPGGLDGQNVICSRLL